jgi:exodeoxyribonuclease-5
VKLSNDQKLVLREIWKWFFKKEFNSKFKNKDYLTFGGYAGTGKTTMMAVFRQGLHERKPKIKVAFCSYTGKATRVLEQTLDKFGARYPKDMTGTIHSLIYEAITNDSDQVIRWRKKQNLDVDLIIVDEASMVDRYIWSDLQSFGKPILAVGDHGQLPPIHGEFNLMENPNIKLEKIHRQAKDNPIIELSEHVRQGKKIPIGDFGQVKKYDQTDWETKAIVEDIISNYDDDWLILVGYNRSRIQLNNEIRRMNGIMTEEPEAGDRIICLKNNHQKGIYNGMRGRITAIREKEDEQGQPLWYEMSAEMDDGTNYSGKVLQEQFNANKTIDKPKNLSYEEMGDLFDFGYVLTVHKAQGSQAPKVLLFEERFKQMSDDEWKRWLYTAVTRAEEELIIVG